MFGLPHLPPAGTSAACRGIMVSLLTALLGAGCGATPDPAPSEDGGEAAIPAPSVDAGLLPQNPPSPPSARVDAGPARPDGGEANPDGGPPATLSSDACDPTCGARALCLEGTCHCAPSDVGDPYVGCHPYLPPEGFVGSPCSSATACSEITATPVCLLEDEGYWDGQCTVPCTRTCPDLAGYPVTFCPDLGGDESWCFSREDGEIFPDTQGCRVGFRAVPLPRQSEGDVVVHTCVPETWLSDGRGCTDVRNLLQAQDCYLDTVSFGDDELRGLTRQLLEGDATSSEAERFLDRNFAFSQAYLETLLGYAPYPNFTPGHQSPSAMKGIVLHYTGSQVERPTLGYFTSSAPHASTHFMIGSAENGRLVQLFSHRHRTWHAGSDYNHTHFGIDFANAGYLLDGNEGYEDYAGRAYTTVLPLHGSNPVEVIGGIPGGPTKYAAYTTWQPYTYDQLLSFVLVSRALHLVYALEEEQIVRHGDVSSSRVDPGPALPTSWLRELIFSTENVLAEGHWLSAYKWTPDYLTAHPDAR